MSSFKQLSKSDVTVVANRANKQWNLSYCPYPTSSEYLTIYKGTNVTGSFSLEGDPVTEGQYERLVYTQINQMFYQEYTASLDTSSLMFNVNTYESASQQRPTSSYFIYNDNKNLIQNFPTGAMEGIRVLAINQNIFGNKILPGNFQLSSSVYNIKDDSYGNLFDYSSSITHVGNIYYAQGLGIITNQDYQLMFPLPPLAKNDIGYFLTTDTPKIISASLNDDGRSGTINTGSIILSGSAFDLTLWSTGSNGTIILTTTVPGTYSIYYTIGADVAGSCPVILKSNKAKVTAIVTAPTTTTTTSTTTTTTTLPPTTTTTTSTTTSTTTEPTTTTSTTTTTTTPEPTTTTTTTTTTTSTTTTTTTLTPEECVRIQGQFGIEEEFLNCGIYNLYNEYTASYYVNCTASNAPQNIEVYFTASGTTQTLYYTLTILSGSHQGFESVYTRIWTGEDCENRQSETYAITVGPISPTYPTCSCDTYSP